MVTGLIYGALIIGAALVATMIINQPQQEGMSANTLESFNTTSSNEGSVVTVVMGKAKITGNLLWFGNLKTVGIPTEGGGKGGGGGGSADGGGYTYYMDIWQGICIGPGVSIEMLWEQNKEIDNEGYVLNPGDELYFPTPTTDGDLAIPYASPLNPMAHVFMEQRNIGDNVSFLPTYHYLINKLSQAPLTYANETYGVNPAAAIYDTLELGGGSLSDVVLSTFQDAADYWHSKDYAVNIVLNKQEAVRDTINRIFTYVDGNIRYDNEGNMELIAWKDTDTFVDTLDEDDYKSFTFKRNTWDNVPTDFRANFIDREQEYTTRTIRARNTAAAAISGQDEPMSIDLTAFIDLDMASRRLWELMKRLSYPEAQVQCTVSLAHSAVREGDVVRLNHTEYGLTAADFRVQKVELAENNSNDIVWSCTQELASLFDSEYQSGGSPGWVIPDYAPVIALAVEVFELPFNNITLNAPAYLLLVARAGVETSFNVHYSPTTTDYENKASFTTFAQRGGLAETYPSSTYAIDDDVGILYIPTREDPAFSTLTRAGLFSSTRVAVMGSELVSFQTVEVEGEGFRLKGCIRGLLNTPISSHASGSVIWLTEINDNILTGISVTSFNLKLSPVFGTDAVDISTISPKAVNYSQKALGPWDIAGIGVVRSGSTVDITVQNTTQLIAGAGINPATSSPVVHPYSMEGTIEYWTSLDLTKIESSSNEFTITTTSAFTLYVRQKLTGHYSNTETVYIAATDGVYATVGDNDSGLEHVIWGSQGWIDIMNRNTQRLNDNLLTVSGLLDVNDSAIVDTNVLIWDDATSKFVPGDGSIFITTTTTTTTTTSSSSTTASHSTTTFSGTTTTSSITTTTALVIPEFSPSNMTAESTPTPFVVSASTSYSSLLPWKAFDGGKGSGQYWISNGETDPWLKIDIGTYHKLQYYEISVNTIPENARAPKDWTMEGSNTGAFSGEQATLDTVTGETAWTGGETRTFTVDTATTAYRYFRLNISANNGDASYTQCAELDLFGTAGSAPTTTSTTSTTTTTAVPFGGESIKVTIDHTKIDSALTNIPIVFNLSDSCGTSDYDASAFFTELTYSPDDDFTGTDGDSYDIKRWYEIDHANFPNPLTDILSNKLHIDSGVATGGASYKVVSKFKLTGDFDIQFEYSNIDPTGDFAVAGFNMDGNQFGVGSWINVDRYYISVSSATYFSRTYDYGKMRMTRVGSTVTVYYIDGAGDTWTTSQNTTITTDDIPATLWAYGSASGDRMEIDIDNFTVNSADGIVWDDGEPNRKKIKVYSSNHTTECKVELEPGCHFSDKKLVLHILAPSISESVDEVFYLDADSSWADNSTNVGDVGETPAQAVWDSNYKAVYHMAQDPSGTAPQLLDSTGSGLDMNMTGSMTSDDLVDGAVGKAIDFDGTSDYFSLTTSVLNPGSGDFSIEAIIKTNGKTAGGDHTDSMTIVSKGTTGDNPVYVFTILNTGEMQATIEGTGSQDKVSSTGTVDDDVIHSVVMRVNRTTDTLDIIIDGVIDGTVDFSGVGDIDPTNSFKISIYTLTSPYYYYFKDLISEVRYSSTLRSVAWSKATNHALKDTLLSMEDN